MMTDIVKQTLIDLVEVATDSRNGGTVGEDLAVVAGTPDKPVRMEFGLQRYLPISVTSPYGTWPKGSTPPGDQTAPAAVAVFAEWAAQAATEGRAKHHGAEAKAVRGTPQREGLAEGWVNGYSLVPGSSDVTLELAVSAQDRWYQFVFDATDANGVTFDGARVGLGDLLAKLSTFSKTRPGGEPQGIWAVMWLRTDRGGASTRVAFTTRAQ